MDFVYICKDGDNDELKYSIRSVVASFPEANIWVVGGKPEWYVGNYIKVPQNLTKYKNAFYNLKSITESNEISESFVLMNDDFYIIKKINNIDNYHGGSLLEKINLYQKINSNLMLKKLFVRCLFLLDFGFVTFGNKSMVAQIHHLLPVLFLLLEVYVKRLNLIHLYYFQRCLGNPETLLLKFYRQLYCKLC